MYQGPDRLYRLTCREDTENNQKPNRDEERWIDHQISVSYLTSLTQNML